MIWAGLIIASIAAGAGGDVTTGAAASEADARQRPVSEAVDENGLLWYDVRALSVHGAGWPDAAAAFRRLPAGAQGVVREPVWQLAQHTSGLRVEFVTDATEIWLRWTLLDERPVLEYMTACAADGFDLYARHNGDWQWCGLARPTQPKENRERILRDVPAGPRAYLLYFPLFNGVQSVEIGTNAAAFLANAPSDPEQGRAPVVYYGTSITHGASASRPGMTYPAILGRRLSHPFINLGFSSNGTMDSEMADLLGELDAAAFVIDCMPNMTVKDVQARTAPFVQRLRTHKAKIPIVLVESFYPTNAWLLPRIVSEVDAKNEALRHAYDELKTAGTALLYYIPGERLMGEDAAGAVDGIHPSDLGFVRISDRLEPLLHRVVWR